MGIDATIFVRANGDEPKLERPLPSGYRLQRAQDYAPTGATHEVDTLARYYGAGYERGPWPELCAVLMLLHASPDVEKVWYGGDNVEDAPECPPARVLEISAHFMEHGHRPYRNAFK